MGGEWLLLTILPEFNIIMLNEANNVSKIFPPKQYRPQYQFRIEILLIEQKYNSILLIDFSLTLAKNEKYTFEFFTLKEI